MHRHCIRSAISQCTEPACKRSLQTAQRLCFSTSSQALSSTSKTPAKPSKHPKDAKRPEKTNATEYRPVQAKFRPRDSKFEAKPKSRDSRAEAYPRPRDSRVESYPNLRSSRAEAYPSPMDLEEANPKPRDPRAVYRNPAGSDRGFSLNERVENPITTPTPAPFISPKPLRQQLINQETKAFVAGEDVEDSRQEADVDLEEELALMANFTPGTFVEIRRNERVLEALVLCNLLKERTWRVICLASSGEIVSSLLTNIHFAVPNLISADLASRCGSEVVPETPQALNARIEALKQLRLVSIQAEQASQGSRMWDRQRIFHIYEEVKHHDPTQWSTVTLEHVTSLLYTQPGYINYYATHRYLMERPLRYIADTGYIRSQQFRVRPQRDIEEIETVDKWIADYRMHRYADGPYKLFIEKAQRVLEDYPKKRLRKTGPMTQVKERLWNASDQVILSFLLRSLQQHTAIQLDPYAVGRNSIVADITPITEVTDDAIHDLLIKLRVIAPWQDLHALSPQLNPSTDFSTQFPIEKEAEAILRASSYPAATKTVLGPLDLLPHDPLDSVRHDFGDMRVFVIDDPTAKELDDGISLERIPTEPENHWVHVHIADPARILHPGHALSLRARKQFSAVYLGTANYPMLPGTLMHDPKYGLSLTDSSETKEVNRVLTFSVKLDAQGEILDYKLRAGILRNVCKTTYNEVNLALGEKVPARLYPFGGSKDQEKRPSLTEADIADLRIFKQLADAQVVRRLQRGVVVPEDTFAEVEFNTTPPLEIQSPCLSGSLYQGFPEMQYMVGLSSGDDQGARNLVSEMMKLGCRVASRVALDHNLPVVRRSLQPFFWKSDKDYQKALDMRNSQGYIPMQEFVKFDIYATAGYYTQQPDAHYQLGLPAGEGYVRATSPLRRYMDLVTHWQFHHILLGANAPPRPPFSVEDTEKLIIEAGIQDVQIRRLQKANSSFYALTYIKRFADNFETSKVGRSENPLARMKAWTLRLPVQDHANSINCPVMLPELGIGAQLHNVPHQLMDLPTSSNLTVKLQSIQLGLRRTKMIVELV